MRTNRVFLLVVFAAAVIISCGGGGDGDTDAGTDTDLDADTDSDTDTGADTDTDTGTGTEAENCEAGGNWYDPDTGLCWQNPSSDLLFNGIEALAFCDDLSLGGHDDWRLPLIQELISLIRGCWDGAEVGNYGTNSCLVNDPDCLEAECNDFGCAYCDESAGEDDDPEGCYWDPGLAGDCGSFFSSSNHDGEETGVWFVPFRLGGVAATYIWSELYVRCVRSGS
jgi:hypothetical protein